MDVMVRDLVDTSIAQIKLKKRKEIQKVVDEAVENTILTGAVQDSYSGQQLLLRMLIGVRLLRPDHAALMGKDVGDRSTWKTLLRSGQLDNQKIEIEVPENVNRKVGQEGGGQGKQIKDFQEIVFQISNAAGKPAADTVDAAAPSLHSH